MIVCYSAEPTSGTESGEEFKNCLLAMRQLRGRNLTVRRHRYFLAENTNMEAKTSILTKVGVSSTQRYEMYLGIPALTGCLRVTMFNDNQRSDMEQNKWMEGEISFSSQQRDSSKGDNSSNSYIYYECVLAT